jgi:hypothetical protein
MLTDYVIESLDGGEPATVVSASYQIYLTPELVRVFDTSAKIATNMSDEFVSTHHLLFGSSLRLCKCNSRRL